MSKSRGRGENKIFIIFLFLSLIELEFVSIEACNVVLCRLVARDHGWHLY